MGIPRNEDQQALWMNAFQNGIALNTAMYFLSNGDSDTISVSVAAFLAARAVANAPSTRTMQTVDSKDAAKASALGVCRLFYGLIQKNAGISNDDKVAIGVTPLGSSRTPRPCPQSSPALSVAASTPGAITLEYRDSMNNNAKAKPFGAEMCQLFVVVDENNASAPDDAKFVGNYTTNPMAAIFESADRGKQATFFARWGGRRNEFGQWSLPLSMTVAA